MKQLVPDVADVADLGAYEAGLERPARRDRPWLLCNMIASADGAVEIDGVSRPLGGPADTEMFRALRSLADVILVGAGTVRHERYRAPRHAEGAALERRRSRGQGPAPRLAVLTASGQLDPGLPLFSDPADRPLIMAATATPHERRRALAERAEVVVAGAERVDVAVALGVLHRGGARVVLAEGGPTLNAQLIAADVVDEWRLTLSPVLAAGDATRAAVGPAPDEPHRFTLDRLLVADDLVFTRYLRR